MKALTVAFFILIIAALALWTTPELASSRARSTPTPTTCTTVYEGMLVCGQAFATSPARPGDVQRKATATRTNR